MTEMIRYAAPSVAAIRELSDEDLLERIGQSTNDLRAYLEEAVRRGLSQARIGEALGISQQAVSKRMVALEIEPMQVQASHPKRTTEVVPDAGVVYGEIVDGGVQIDMSDVTYMDTPLHTQQVQAKARDRVRDALNRIDGMCQGLADPVQIERALSAVSDDELKAWIAMTNRARAALLNTKRELQRSPQ